MHVRLGVACALAVLSAAGAASATTVLEIGDNGSEQMGRGGAWVARASDPLAAFYNPAGLAGQETRLTGQGSLNILGQCFTRMKALNDTTQGDNPGSATGTFAPGSMMPQVCNSGAPFPDPTLGFTYRLTPRIGLGIAVLGPSAAGKIDWSDPFSSNPYSPQTSAQRYLLIGANTLLITPTFGVGVEPVDNLRFGAAFIWGIAAVDFSNTSYAANQGGEHNSGSTPANNDVRGEIKGSNLFIPGVTLGTIWSPSDMVDIAGWYKYMQPISVDGDVKTQVGVGKNAAYTDTGQANCGDVPPAGTPQTCAPGAAKLKVTIPMEAKIGVRFHVPRPGVDLRHLRDPLSQDIFDVEADFTWANNSQFDAVHLNFSPANPDGSTPYIINGTPGSLPGDASIPHNFKDVFGVRIGGDYNVIADTLAIRAGGYYETKAQDSTYQGIDFVGRSRLGIALGGTWRIRMFKKDKKDVELMIGLGHTFIPDSINNGPNGVPALAGTQCYNPTNLPFTGGGPCPNGYPSYRTAWAVNLGTISSSFTQINLGASYRF